MNNSTGRELYWIASKPSEGAERFFPPGRICYIVRLAMASCQAQPWW